MRSDQPTRREFLATGAAVGLLATTVGADTPAPSAADRPFELSELTIADLQDGMRTGKFTARTLTERYLARIEAIHRFNR